MKIFFQSRGISQDNGFRWLDQNNSPNEPSHELEGASSLIDSQYYSILLKQKNQKLILYITGMWANNRTDFMGRRIRNSVLWIMENTEEKKIRSLLIQALGDQAKFSQDIDQAVVAEGKYEFTVLFDQLNQVISSHLDELGDENCIKKICRFGGDSKKLREELVKEIKASKLPQNENLLLVTTIKNEETLQKLDFWRGLSNKIKVAEWIEFEPDVFNGNHALMAGTQYSSASEKNNKNAAFFFIIFLVFCVILIGLLLSTPLINPDKKEPPTSGEQTKTTTKEMNVLTCQKAIKDGYFLSPCIPKPEVEYQD